VQPNVLKEGLNVRSRRLGTQLRDTPSWVADIDRLLKMMERGDFDLIAVGRAQLVDPEWAHKVQSGRLDQLLPWNPAVLESLT
jgi:2,4-dienoyl-CoA reductase-like NADH-dependent reductase (Old Yellow Enzyme family)